MGEILWRVRVIPVIHRDHCLESFLQVPEAVSEFNIEVVNLFSCDPIAYPVNQCQDLKLENSEILYCPSTLVKTMHFSARLLYALIHEVLQTAANHTVGFSP